MIIIMTIVMRTFAAAGSLQGLLDTIYNKPDNNYCFILYYCRSTTQFSGILIDPYESDYSTKMTVLWNIKPNGYIHYMPQSIMKMAETLIIESWISSLTTEYRKRK